MGITKNNTGQSHTEDGGMFSLVRGLVPDREYKDADTNAFKCIKDKNANGFADALKTLVKKHIARINDVSEQGQRDHGHFCLTPDSTSRIEAENGLQTLLEEVYVAISKNVKDELVKSHFLEVLARARLEAQQSRLHAIERRVMY